MDSARRHQLEEQLAKAEYRVFQGQLLLERQRENLERRRSHGHDVKLATNLLAAMEETQRLHEAHRDRLRRELAELH